MFFSLNGAQNGPERAVARSVAVRPCSPVVGSAFLTRGSPPSWFSTNSRLQYFLVLPSSAYPASLFSGSSEVTGCTWTGAEECVRGWVIRKMAPFSVFSGFCLVSSSVRNPVFFPDTGWNAVSLLIDLCFIP